ncbi:DUF5926 family protein [Bogoriella caseilytica]|nr:DUF5926 family protein [Bogoriella caseilytica]
MAKKNRKKKLGPKPGAEPKTKKVEYVERPFEGLPGETEIVAMREVVPAASTTLRTTEDFGGREFQLVTLLPDFLPALRREDGTVLVALQTAAHSGDASRDVAVATLMALELEPGEPLRGTGIIEPGPRLQDILDLTEAPEVTVHDDFVFWIGEEQAKDPQAAQALENANESIVPTAPVEGVTSMYWCRMGKEFVRWARPEDPEKVLDGIARLHAERSSAIDEGSRFVGAFRSCGLSIPVWELARGAEADELVGPAAAFDKRLTAAIAEDAPLTPEQRRARAGLVSRQVSLR